MILDSNIIIYSIEADHIPLQAYLLDRTGSLYSSEISKLDVLGFSRLDDSDKLYFQDFFSSITNLPITSTIIQEAIRLR